MWTPRGSKRGPNLAVCEENMVTTQLGGRDLPASPRYQPSGTRPPNRGALSHFAPVL